MIRSTQRTPDAEHCCAVTCRQPDSDSVERQMKSAVSSAGFGDGAKLCDSEVVQGEKRNIAGQAICEMRRTGAVSM
jgi:hypothetical protein